MRINSFRLAKFAVFDNNVFICECVCIRFICCSTCRFQHMFKDSVMQKFSRKLLSFFVVFVLCFVVLVMGE